MPSPNTNEPPADSWNCEYNTNKRQRLFRTPPKKTAYPALYEAVKPHTDSFNALIGDQQLLAAAVKDIGTKIFLDGGEVGVKEPDAEQHGGEPEASGRRNRLSIRIREVFLEKSTLPPSNKFSVTKREIFPAECRERHVTYRGRLRARLEYRLNSQEWKESIREFGQLPIMLRTNRCHLEKLNPAQLVQRKEESDELGGYFIVNGNERLIRLLIMPKRNFPMGIVRPRFRDRGEGYTKYGISMRCVRPDQTSQTNVLHCLEDGNVTFRFSWKKNEYLVPVIMILKALIDTSDREIFEGIVGPPGSKAVEDTFMTERAQLLLRTYKSYRLYTRAGTISYLGEKFRPVLGVPNDMADDEAGAEFLRKVVLVHLGNVDVSMSQNQDKFNMLVFMIRKLYKLAAGDCLPDNPDALSNQEILLPGSLYGMIIKEKIEDWMSSVGNACEEWSSKNSNLGYADPQFLKDFEPKVLRKTNENIGALLEYFLSTGNLVSTSGLDLQQVSGFTVVAEKINFYRFISHFRSIHRGSFFAQLKITTVRKLLPESWGFLCPVHTPDGAPCGLLNHLAHQCRVTTSNLDMSSLLGVLVQLGMLEDPSTILDEKVTIQLDGRILGYCMSDIARSIADSLRYRKVHGTHGIPLELEIGFIPDTEGGMYPGIYMSSHPSRMIRAVKYLPSDKKDYVGAFEQPFMEIACRKPDVQPKTTHIEYSPTSILSILANQTPFSDYNQSPRNMYQCQMAKQTMGTPGTAHKYRTDNKSYHLQTTQTPIARPPLYNEYGLDNFPNGTNAVVAVISYTGYDMDDAMIINKSAHERGFGYGTIYKTKVINLENSSRGRSAKAVERLFGFAPEAWLSERTRNRVDSDGLPFVGQMVCEGDVLAVSHTVTYDSLKDKYVNHDGQNELHKYKDPETAFVEEVRIIGSDTGAEPCQSISIKLRIPRSPVIGDKFSSRHGQKGVCSQKWPTVDMPFSESGIVPDVIINPHAFPSRMTIGMFVESLAGKAGALHGFAQDSTPWRFDEVNTAAGYFGEQLRVAGYNYHGNEPMYSGITGQEFAADIYLGVVFYQRLRHMVNDKFQVRTTGPVTQLTGQPIKGRSKGGGIRIGEMERDSLLAHGCAFLLQDRLMNCSDYTKTWVCVDCGSFISTTYTVGSGGKQGRRGTGIVRCRRCAKKFNGITDEDIWEDGQGQKWTGGENTTVIAVPGVLKYLDVELSAMGVRMKFNIKH